jgi:hypothetical protein
MSEQSLQFERAEYAQPVAAQVVCAACNKPVIQSYYEIGGAIICSTCREARDHAMEGFGGGRFVRALGAGAGVGIAGSLVWFGVAKLLDMELALISIAIGYGVGKAVSWGSRGRGGWLYQALAMILTYSSISGANYLLILNYISNKSIPLTLPILLRAIPLAFEAPFLQGAENIIGILIIAFGLWEAWKFNKRVDAAITGPYTVTPAAPAPATNV